MCGRETAKFAPPVPRYERRRIAVPLSFITQRPLTEAGRRASHPPRSRTHFPGPRRGRACSLLTRPLCSLGLPVLFPVITLWAVNTTAYSSILPELSGGVKCFAGRSLSYWVSGKRLGNLIEANRDRVLKSSETHDTIDYIMRIFGGRRRKFSWPL